MYRWICENAKVSILLVPAGEPLGPEDKDCLKTKEPGPGASCRCAWLGAFALGESATIEADTGRVVTSAQAPAGC